VEVLYCNYCNVHISGFHTICPLCQNKLEEIPDENQRLFPLLEQDETFIKSILDISLLVSLIIAVICVVINYAGFSGTWWSAFVAAGIICAWIVIGIGLPRKANIMKTLQYELYITCSLAVLWDIFTGWHRWSIDFVLPYASGSTMIIMTLLSNIWKKNPREYLVYSILVHLLGYVPILLIALNLLKHEIPSILCISCNIILTSGIISFKRNAAYREMKKKLHI